LPEALRKVQEGNTVETVSKLNLRPPNHLTERIKTHHRSNTRENFSHSKLLRQTPFFSPSLAKQHREHLMTKLDLHDTAGLTRYAISAGIIESSVQLTIV
jgi:hypothetical protein